MSIDSPGFSDSSLDDVFSHNEAIKPTNERISCTICRLQLSTVTYFNVPVCSGCRAFFRRSVKSGKKYHCLNNRLCGKNQLVPNRRVCKFCRFNRCISAGMLDAKVKMQTRLMESVRVELNNPTIGEISANTTTTAINKELPDYNKAVTTDSTQVSTINSSSSSQIITGYIQLESNYNPSRIDILGQFNRLRRQIIFERSRMYGNEFQIQKISSGAFHDMQVGLDEYKLFNRVVSTTDNLFNELDASDWKTLNMQEYSMWWSICEQTLATVRNQGHEINRIYNTDGSYTPLNSDHTRNHWKFIYPSIFGNRDAIFDSTMDYMFNVQLIMCSTVGSQLAKVCLDETEFSALLLLLMTRSSCLEIVSKKATQQFLRNTRNSVLSSLANHLKCSGRNIDERMAQIIFLITDFQNLGRLIQHSMRLLMSATDYRALPNQFFHDLEETPSFNDTFKTIIEL